MKIKLILIILLTALAPLSPIGAQQPAYEFIFNWKSDAYAPAFYKGKILATNDSRITAAFNLIRGGKLIDLSKKEIRWFIGGKLIERGAGKQTISFQRANGREREIVARVEIVGLNGEDLSKIFIIPTTAPEAVIDAPEITAGTNILRILPFYFNIGDLSQLSFKWEVNNEETLGDAKQPNILRIDIPEGARGAELRISGSARSNNGFLEAAKKVKEFIIR